jgi:Glycosyltransferase family 28 N-terminal domain
MRVLLSTIGSRGDVQPLVALAVQLRELGQEARVCAPPDFRDWIAGLGIPFVPLGPEVRSTAKPHPAQARPSAEQIRQMIEGTVATRSFGGRGDGNPLRLCRLLSDNSAVPTPRATQSAGMDTERRNGRQSDTMG